LPSLQWISICDLSVDPTYHQPITGKGRRKVDRIARSFSWSRFATVIVAPISTGKFVIIDGQCRTTAAAVAGFDKVPCQIVQAVREERVVAFRTINRAHNTSSRMAVHSAECSLSEPHAVQLAQVCARADVEVLRYPVPVGRQRAGQTMAVGALTQCLKRYGEEALITALQCVTQTTNNRPGVLSARIIKALCTVLGNDRSLRDSGLSLLEAFDTIDLHDLSNKATADGMNRSVSPVQLLIERIRSEVGRRLHKSPTANPVEKMLDSKSGPSLTVLRRSKLTTGPKSPGQLPKF
jgi:hypothetical protein